MATMWSYVKTGAPNGATVMGVTMFGFAFFSVLGNKKNEERMKIEKVYREKVSGVMELRGALGDAEAMPWRPPLAMARSEFMATSRASISWTSAPPTTPWLRSMRSPVE